MKNLAGLTTLAAAVLMLFGCATTSKSGMGGGAADFPTLAKEAGASIKKANSIGGEWRDSKKFVKKAEKAVKAGDMKKALELANKAKDQGKMGYDQAMSQKDAGPWLF